MQRKGFHPCNERGNAMGRLSREAGGLGEYSDDNANEQPEPELEPDDGWPVMDLPPVEDDEDEPA
jgi:hypothetical protein